MLRSADRLRKAEKVLQRSNKRSKQNLAIAAVEFWAAMVYRNELPEELQQRSTELEEMLLAKGTFHSTIDAMDDATVRFASSELSEFLQTVETYDCGSRVIGVGLCTQALVRRKGAMP